MSLSESWLLQRRGKRYCCKQEQCDEWLEMQGREGRLCVWKKQKKTLYCSARVSGFWARFIGKSRGRGWRRVRLAVEVR